MKQILVALSLVIIVAVALAGCGKSAEFKKMEATLNSEVMQKHDDLMKSMSGLDAMTDQITAATTKFGEIAGKYPKLVGSYTTDDLAAAKAKIAAAKTAMEGWMKGFKPYDEMAKHEDVMATMGKYKADLTAVQEQFSGAMTAAKDALAGNAKFVDECMAKMPKRK